MKQAIRWEKDVHGVIRVQNGTCDFVRHDEDYVKFHSHGRKGHQLIHAANVVVDTPSNRKLIEEIKEDYEELKDHSLKVESRLFQRLNKIERP